MLIAFIMPYFMQMHLYSGVLQFVEGTTLADMGPFLAPEVDTGLVSIQLHMMYSFLLVKQQIKLFHMCIFNQLVCLYFYRFS